ncbi:hypothetical protein [Mesorhizobium sp. WSM3879]|uniref:hypothetical protein n=1 Tax=Mesorhizobium sp. WSM3879 TaxID=2029406 RepID=UPI00117CA354|nr:hypothetical protein [Mesorhizobium sp. WSM3879]
MFPKEAALVGLLVAGYGELDICLGHVCGLAVGDKFAVLEALNKVSSEQARIEIANSLAKHILEAKGFGTKFGEAVGAINLCRKIRNQYAHAQWTGVDGKLAFTRTESINWREKDSIRWSTLSLDVLEKQELYFEYTRKCLIWLEFQLGTPTPGVAIPWPKHMHRPSLDAGAATTIG